MILKVSIFVFLSIFFLDCKSRRLVLTDLEAPIFVLQVSSKAPKTLFNTWIYANKDDKDDKILIFKTKDLIISNANPRESFTILESGKFIDQSIKRKLQVQSDTGKWIYSKSEKTLDVSFIHFVAYPIPETEQFKRAYSLKIKSIEKNTLKVEKIEY